MSGDDCASVTSFSSATFLTGVEVGGVCASIFSDLFEETEGERSFLESVFIGLELVS